MNMESDEVIDARADALAEAFEDLKHDLVQLREDHGLDQQAVADLLGMSQSAVSQFERHDANPTLRTLRRYALAVGARLEIRVVDDWDRRPVSVAPVAGFTWVPDKDIAGTRFVTCPGSSDG